MDDPPNQLTELAADDIKHMQEIIESVRLNPTLMKSGSRSCT